MLTNEERIYDMLSAKIGYVPSIKIEKRETKKNVIKLFKTLLNTRLYEQLKKICKNSLKCSKVF
jgi:hypothetical protein